jgi:FMN phosphatase YigB (HAD superfamily)
MKKAILIDLDGTLTDTADVSFKLMKDGKVDTDLSKINLITGAKDFVTELKNRGHEVFIISDSHPSYVNKIATAYFNIPSLSLTDKPNTTKARNFLTQYSHQLQGVTEYFMIGDTWLDIELGRGLKAMTVLVELYSPQNIEERDGIGQDWKQIKSGPTFYSKSFEKVLDIIENPSKNLLCIESVFQGEQTVNPIKFKGLKYERPLLAFRALGRQNAGECDNFGVADKYFEFSRQGRSQETLNKLAQATKKYIDYVLSFSFYTWDYFTFVSDKSTTNPPNKMKDFFDLVQVPITKIQLLEWQQNMSGSIRDLENYRQRLDFVNNHLHVIDNFDLKDKSIIIIDDQFTTGGTAHSICQKFKERGAKNLLFLSLFYLDK